MPAPSEAALLKEYELVTQQFRELTEIRFKLLAFLPLGTLGTLSLLTSQKEASSLSAPFASFGFFVTLAILVYNLRNDQHYDELIGRAAHIERDLKLFDGSFAQRPDRWHRLGPGLYVEHRWPIDLVYVASAALWLWMGLQSFSAHTNGFAALATPLVVASFVFVLMWYLRRSRRVSSERYKHAVRDAMELLVDALPGLEAEQRAAQAGRVLARHLGGGQRAGKRYEHRILFYLQPSSAEEFLPSREDSRLDDRAASHILAQTINMPARWIRDVYCGRRGA